MRTAANRTWTAALFFAFGVAAGAWLMPRTIDAQAPATAQTSPLITRTEPLSRSPAPAFSAANPQLPTLYSTLWTMTSGEYEAICLQTYNFAEQKLDSLIAQAKDSTKPLAVVMDLDETVLDTTRFQSSLILAAKKFNDEEFHQWIREHPDETTLVPGAKRFIESAEKKGVVVVYITNRYDSVRSSTIQTLKLCGLNTCCIEDRLLMRAGGSDKSERRAKVESKHRVLAYFGDNLGDFSSEFAPAGLASQPDPIAARKELVRKEIVRWGTTWFVLPNPIYGDWTKLIDFNRPLANKPSAGKKL